MAIPIALHLVLCLGHLWSLTRSPLLRYLTLDLKSYDSWARAILAGDWLGQGVFYQDPLYPYLMALVYRLTGAEVVHVLLAQIVGSALTLCLAWRLADHLFGARAALIALWVAALYAPAVYYACKPEKASFAALAVTGALLALVRAREKGGLRWLLAGTLLGLAGLLRGNVLLVAAAAIVLVVSTRLAADGWLERARAAAGLAAGLGLILLPVLVRNRLVGEDWVFTTSQAGANLFIGNQPGNVTGTYAVPHFVRPSPLYEEEDFRRHAEHAMGRQLPPSQVSRFYLGEVAAWAVREPAAFLRLQGIKALAFLDHWEYPDNWSLYFVGGFSPLLRAPLPSYGLVIPFALLGVVAVLQKPRAPAQVFFVLLVLSYAASVVAFYVFSRYRFPIAFALIGLGAHGAARLGQDLVEGRARRVGLSLLTLALAFCVSFFAKRNDESGDLSQRYYNLSASFLNDGRIGEAESLAHEAASRGPRNPLPYLTLAEVAAARGDVRAEREALGLAFERRPDDDEVRVRIVRLRGRTEGYRRAAELAGAWLADRESYRLRQALVDSALRQEAFAAAREGLGELLARYPEDAWGAEKRIALAIHEGDWQVVIGAAEARLRRAPRERRWLAVLALAYREAGEPVASREYAERAGLPWPLPPRMVLDDPLARQ